MFPINQLMQKDNNNYLCNVYLYLYVFFPFMKAFFFLKDILFCLFINCVFNWFFSFI